MYHFKLREIYQYWKGVNIIRSRGGALFSMSSAYKVEWKNLLNRNGGVKGMIPAVVELTTFFLLCLSVSA